MEVSSAIVPETTADSASQISTHQTVTNGINTEDPIQVQTQGQTPGSVTPNAVTMALATRADDTPTQRSGANTCAHSGIITHFKVDNHMHASQPLLQVLGCGCSSLQYF